MSIDSFPKQKASWPMLMLGAGLIAAVLALAALYNAFYLGDEALIQSYLQRLNAFPKNAQQTQVIIAAPAKPVNLEIQAGNSIKALWASEGLTINISETRSGAGESAAVISGEKTWNENIPHNAIFERKDPIFILAGFTLAPNASVGGELYGRIEGELVYPVIVSGGVQEDVASELSVPFVVRVVPPAEIARVVRGQAKTTLWITGPIALILIAVPTAYLRRHRKAKADTRQAKPTGGK